MGLEGIVAKRLDKPYRSGDREDWIKHRGMTPNGELRHPVVKGWSADG